MGERIGMFNTTYIRDLYIMCNLSMLIMDGLSALMELYFTQPMEGLPG